jgi:hypothetical protein
MANDPIDGYIAVLQLAYVIGDDLVNLIKDHARKTLTPEEYAALDAKWDEDIERAKRNAGL